MLPRETAVVAAVAAAVAAALHEAVPEGMAAAVQHAAAAVALAQDSHVKEMVRIGKPEILKGGRSDLPE